MNILLIKHIKKTATCCFDLDPFASTARLVKKKKMMVIYKTTFVEGNWRL